MLQLGLQKACWSHQRKMDNFLANVSWNTRSSHLTIETVSPEGIFCDTVQVSSGAGDMQLMKSPRWYTGGDFMFL